MPFSVLALCQIRAGANDMCDTFNIFIAKPATGSFTGLVNAIYFTELLLIACSCAAQRRLSIAPFSSPFLNHPTFYFHRGILFPLQIVHLVLFPPLFQSAFFLFFLARINNVFFQVEFSCCSLD